MGGAGKPHVACQDGLHGGNEPCGRRDLRNAGEKAFQSPESTVDVTKHSRSRKDGSLTGSTFGALAIRSFMFSSSSPHGCTYVDFLMPGMLQMPPQNPVIDIKSDEVFAGSSLPRVRAGLGVNV